MQNGQDLIQRLNQGGKKLSKSHKKIADFIVENYDKAVFMTATKLGDSVGVSESTVVRFANTLGYAGYPQLQKALQELVRHRLTATQRFEMAAEIDPNAVLPTVLKADMQNIRSTIEEINVSVFNDVVKAILRAKHIYVIGLRSAAPLAQFFAYYLKYIFDYVHLISTGSTDVFEDVSRIKKEDILIGISFPRYSNRTMEAMRFAKNQGVEVIGITDGLMSPLTQVATHCLTARTDMASFVDSLAAPLSMINGLIVSLGLQRKQQLGEHLTKLENLWAEHGVYVGKEHE